MKTLLSSKFAGEKVVVSIDFLASLSGNETLTGAITVVVTTNSGVDPSPMSILNGSAQIVGSKILIPVRGGVKNCSYLIKCTCGTTNSDKILEMIATLPINAQ